MIAWASFSATGGVITILDGVGISSITYIGVGEYEINFDAPFANKDYAEAYSGALSSSAARGGTCVGVKLNSTTSNKNTTSIIITTFLGSSSSSAALQFDLPSVSAFFIGS